MVALAAESQQVQQLNAVVELRGHFQVEHCHLGRLLDAGGELGALCLLNYAREESGVSEDFKEPAVLGGGECEGELTLMRSD